METKSLHEEELTQGCLSHVKVNLGLVLQHRSDHTATQHTRLQETMFDKFCCSQNFLFTILHRITNLMMKYCSVYCTRPSPTLGSYLCATKTCSRQCFQKNLRVRTNWHKILSKVIIADFFCLA